MVVEIFDKENVLYVLKSFEEAFGFHWENDSSQKHLT